MTGRQTIRWLPDGRRLHLQDGPIDLVIEAFGVPMAVKTAYRAATIRFASVLDELCAELPALRRRAGGPPVHGRVACRMMDAVAPFANQCFVTPMAAVAGAVADEILQAMTGTAELDRAYVNNGGDIALHLRPEARLTLGLIDRPDRPNLFGRAVLCGAGPVRGVATSGRHGRSFSLGIADAVTVLAPSAAAADAAATLLANAVDLPGHPEVYRAPAASLQPDSDLGDRLVTQEVGTLSGADIAAALDAGTAFGRTILDRGLIFGAALHLMGQTRILGAVPGPALAPRQENVLEPLHA
jgi:ApbE superfamily uncharacterized protein (UPF0280 family)